jgi:hypothetical protein
MLATFLLDTITSTTLADSGILRGKARCAETLRRMINGSFGKVLFLKN